MRENKFMKNGIFVSELTTTNHKFTAYHFCRGNSSKRKTRIGIIKKGRGAYIYLNKRLNVNEGDVVFIPENIYCYSEWHGRPDIEVVYLSCFMHYESLRYAPQVIEIEDKEKRIIPQIATLLSEEKENSSLEAYSLFYKLLQIILPKMKESSITYDKTLKYAIEYISDNWNLNFSVSDLAKKCCVSESTIYHLFQKELGQTPITLLNSIKINVAIEYLENTNYSISTISSLVGFNSENHFRRVFADFTGTTPLKFKKNGYKSSHTQK